LKHSQNLIEYTEESTPGDPLVDVSNLKRVETLPGRKPSTKK
jgi:hypothetical protein